MTMKSKKLKQKKTVARRQGDTESSKPSATVKPMLSNGKNHQESDSEDDLKHPPKDKTHDDYAAALASARRRLYPIEKHNDSALKVAWNPIMDIKDDVMMGLALHFNTYNKDKFTKPEKLDWDTKPTPDGVIHYEDTTCLSWGHDYNFYITGSMDGYVRMWAEDGLSAAGVDKRLLLATILDRRHKGPIFSIKSNPWNYLAVVGGSDGYVMVYHIALGNGQIWSVGGIQAHTKCIIDIEWIEPHLFVCCAGNTLMVCRIIMEGKTGKLEMLWIKNAHEVKINLLRYDPVSKILASSAQSATMRFWDSETGFGPLPKEENIILDDFVKEMKWSPLGHILLIALSDNTVKVIDHRDPTRSGLLYFGHTANVLSIEITRCGRYAITCCTRGEIHLWSIHDCKLVKRYTGKIAMGREPSKTLQNFDLDIELPEEIISETYKMGMYRTTGTETDPYNYIKEEGPNGTYRDIILTQEEYEEFFSEHPDHIHTCGSSNDENDPPPGTSTGETQIKRRRTMKDEDQTAGSSSSAKNFAAVQGTARGASSTAIKAKTVNPKDYLYVLRDGVIKDGEECSLLQWHPTDDKIAISSLNGYTRLYDLSTVVWDNLEFEEDFEEDEDDILITRNGIVTDSIQDVKILKDDEIDGKVTGLCWNRIGDYNAVATEEGWVLTTYFSIENFDCHVNPKCHEGGVATIKFSPFDNNILMTVGKSDQSIAFWRMTSTSTSGFEFVHRENLGAGLVDIVWVAEDTIAYTKSRQNDVIVHVMDGLTPRGAEKKEKIRLFEGHDLPANLLRYDTQMGLLASTGLDKYIVVSTPDYIDRRKPKLFTYTGHEGFISDMCFSPSGAKLASSSVQDCTIRIWDGCRGAGCLHVMKFERENAPHPIAFSPCGRFLANSNKVPWISIWDTDNGRLLYNIKCDDPKGMLGAKQVLWNATSSKLAVSTQEGTLMVVDVHRFMNMIGKATVPLDWQLFLTSAKVRDASFTVKETPSLTLEMTCT